jgi:hypothetical protein
LPKKYSDTCTASQKTQNKPQTHKGLGLGGGKTPDPAHRGIVLLKEALS